MIHPRLPLPEKETLLQYLELDPTSPSGLRWKEKTGRSVKGGNTAGSKHTRYGYWYVTFLGQRYRAHRLVYRILTGEDPGAFDVDHKNGDLDNNLDVRKANKSQNSINSRPRNNTSSQFKGVCWDQSRKKWFARISVNKKRVNIGRFDSEIEAAKAYNEYALKCYGEFARLNEV